MNSSAFVSAHDGLYGRMRLWAMTAITLSILLSILDYSSANIALPVMAHDLGISQAQSIWIVNAYQFASLITLLPFSSLGTRIGYARMSLIGTAVFLLASILCAVATSLSFMMFARALQGIGGACIMSVNLALVRLVYPAAELGKGIGVNGLMIGLGVAMGPSLGAFILALANWHWIFWINIPLGGIALMLGISALPKTQHHTQTFDFPHAVLTVAALGFLVIGLNICAHGQHVPLGSTLLCAGSGLIFLLWKRQSKADSPLFPADLLSLPAMRQASAVAIISFIASNFFLISISFTLQDDFGRSSVVSGLLITAWPIGVVLTSPVSGRMADRFSSAFLASLGLLVMTCGFACLWTQPLTAGNLSIASCIFLAGTGSGLFQPPNNRIIMSSAPKGREGGASGVVSLSRLSGQTLGATAVALVYRLYADHAAQICLGMATAIAFLAAIASFCRIQKKQNDPPISG
ncbi:MFS transporter [Acetobacter sp.]|jgi:DHA2 family multidrug resistance protein-like MFS transporter|uniref:MFS transporter n=1 Tax=Acetobacter sp. TaxID=440 RepID=UPI0025B9557C|nr:MFS transporter [Acetobacter sp.]MCH4089907.1 MFS transporter [Acetobacter sp.]MCI1298603.1 MFS transporter [Acetobacter sp.]MCI1315168.1 MFS transporter [Acetobacter sp.]